MAGAIASAATRTAISGGSFGDNLMRSLPDVIGMTVGNMVAYGVGGVTPKASAGASSAAQAEPTTGAGGGRVGDIWVNSSALQAAGERAFPSEGTFAIDGATSSLTLTVSPEAYAAAGANAVANQIAWDASGHDEATYFAAIGAQVGSDTGYKILAGPDQAEDTAVRINPVGVRTYLFDKGQIGYNSAIGDKTATFVILKEANAAGDQALRDIRDVALFGPKTAASAFSESVNIAITAADYYQGNISATEALVNALPFGSIFTVLKPLGRAKVAAETEASVAFNNGWRTADGKFASPLGSGRAGVNAETAVWDAVDAKQGWSVVRGQVAVRDASGQLRYYDGAAISPRGRVIGLETKSGTAVRTPEQRLFDSTLNSDPSNVARGVGQSKGINVQRSTLIRVP